MNLVEDGHAQFSTPPTISSIGNYRLTFDASGVGEIFDREVSVIEYRSQIFVEAKAEGFALSEQIGKTHIEVVKATPLADLRFSEYLRGYPKVCAALAHQIELLSDITGCQEVGLRLVVVNSPMCPAMHVDRVPLRFVWTVYGSGTEFASTGDALETSPLITVQANRCSLLILKGTDWGDGDEYAAKHRSPSGCGNRVVITLDPL